MSNSYASTSEIAELRQRVRSLEDLLARTIRDIDYQMETTSARSAWQWCEERNLDATNFFQMDFYISPNGVTRDIQKVLLRVKLLPYIFWAVGGGTTGATATGCTIVINGTDRTTALTGGATFTTDQSELNITSYMTATGYNTIKITSSGLGRIRATVFGNLYLNS